MIQASACRPLRPFSAGALVLEPLEARALLSAAPMPDLALLEDPSSAVLRLETTLGVVDIELLADAAPITLGRFLDEFRLGGLDNSAFHRALPGQLLQLGRTRYAADTSAPVRGGFTDYGITLDNPFGTPSRPLNGPAWLSHFDPSREPLAWTVSLTETWADPGSVWAGSITFNLADNPVDPAAADLPATYFTASRVIGRVLPGASRDTLTAIASLDTTQFLAFPDPSASIAFLFDHGSFPVAPGFSPIPGQAPPRHGAVHVEDAEIIKPTGEEGFFADRLFFPEGFAGSGKEEQAWIVNPGDSPAAYQLIVRFETGERDRVLHSGTILPNARLFLPLSGDVYRFFAVGKPYAIELQSTHPLTGTLVRSDFGGLAGETFTSDPAPTWVFAEVVVDPQVPSFVVWHNTGHEPAVVTVTFYAEDADTPSRTIALPTGPLRRGGLHLADWDIPPGRYAVTVAGEGADLVAAASQYDTRSGRTWAGTELGAQPSAAGILPLARLGEGEDQVFTLFNPGETEATVTLTFTPAESPAASVSLGFTVAPGRVYRYDAAELRPTLGEGHFAARFDADAPIVARASHAAFGDTLANHFAGSGATAWRFSNGAVGPLEPPFLRPHTLGISSIAPGGTGGEATAVTITFRFLDRTTLTETLTLLPGATIIFDVHAHAPLHTPDFADARRFYSLEVTAPIPVVAQEWYIDVDPSLNRSGGYGTLGHPSGAVTPVSPMPVA